MSYLSIKFNHLIQNKATNLIFSRKYRLPMQELSKDATNRPHINSWTVLGCSKKQLRRSEKINKNEKETRH